MKRLIGSTFLKSIFLGLMALIIVGVSQKAARADEVTISGSTTGTVTAVPQLTFTGNASFTGTTALGIGSLSGANSLGSFFFSTAPTQPLAGTFSLTVADLFVETGRSAQITAGITGNQSPIPEPTTLLLLGTGLTGVATKLRQRNRARKENR